MSASFFVTSIRPTSGLSRSKVEPTLWYFSSVRLKPVWRTEHLALPPQNWTSVWTSIAAREGIAVSPRVIAPLTVPLPQADEGHRQEEARGAAPAHVWRGGIGVSRVSDLREIADLAVDEMTVLRQFSRVLEIPEIWPSLLAKASESTVAFRYTCEAMEVRCGFRE